MTPLAPLVTRFFRHHLAVEKGVASTRLQVTAMRSSSCADMSAIDSARLRRHLPSRISMRTRFAIIWRISNPTAAILRERETCA